MQFKTKFNLKDEVWVIVHVYTTRKVSCVTCESLGYVIIGSERFTCPKCRGKCLEDQYAGHKSVIIDHGFIGKITVEQTDKYFEKEASIKIKYMLNASGSGSVYEEQDIFPSRLKAEVECENRNSKIKWEDDKVKVAEL